MAGKFGAIPDGFHTITPYICTRDARSAIDFYKRAFGAIEHSRIDMDDGRLGHAELQIGDSRLMLADEFPEINVVSPQTLGGTSVTLHLYVDDVDVTAERAVAEGATVLRPLADNPGLGVRHGIFQCPFGHRWFLASVLVTEATAEKV